MTDKQKLQNLLNAVEAGAATTELMSAAFDGKGSDDLALAAFDAYHGSLDAAKALHEAVLPGWVVDGLDQASNLAGSPWGCAVADFYGSNPSKNKIAYSGHNYDCPARAWLTAILKALIAQTPDPR